MFVYTCAGVIPHVLVRVRTHARVCMYGYIHTHKHIYTPTCARINFIYTNFISYKIHFLHLISAELTHPLSSLTFAKTIS